MTLILDKYGWPVERIRGRSLLNFLHRVLHGRRVVSDLTWQRMQHARQLAEFEALGRAAVEEVRAANQADRIFALKAEQPTAAVPRAGKCPDCEHRWPH
mgnify:CR=1 FL=1